MFSFLGFLFLFLFCPEVFICPSFLSSFFLLSIIFNRIPLCCKHSWYCLLVLPFNFCVLTDIYSEYMTLVFDKIHFMYNMSFSLLSSPLCSNANLHLSILFQVLLQVKIQLKLIYCLCSFASFPVFLLKVCTVKSMICLFHEILLSLSFIHIVHSFLLLIIPSGWHGMPSYYALLLPSAQHHCKLKSVGIKHTSCFLSNTLISNTRLNLAKNQAKTKQHPEVELLLFENYLLFSSMLSSKTIIRCSKNVQKNKCVYLNETISWLIILKRSGEIKNRWHRYDINQTSLNEYAKYKICLSIMMVMCKKQHLSKIWSWIYGTVKQS